jgi:DinB superfamily
MSTEAAGFVERLDAVRGRLDALAPRPAPAALTDPDPRTGERWDWGQVWAHIAEFPEYWLGQIRRARAGWAGQPVPFGRVSSDPARIQAIEDDRHTPPADLLARVSADLDDCATLIQGLDAEGWRLEGLHSTLGVMDMERILDEFVVGHLEGHADQLEGLVDERRPSG